jgi:hypothetical protein
MAFSDTVRTLANQIEERRKHCATEEAAKQALVLPFLHHLGFDIYNPSEVIPEYRAGWAKATEKVDYALLVGGKLAIFVECKGATDTLGNYDPQLAKYFNSTPECRFSVITNGIRYRFFTDLQEPNLLDKKPFFEFNFEEFTDPDIGVLERFRREVFNAHALVSYAEDLVFLSALKAHFKELIRDPSDDFVRFAVVAAKLSDSRVTQRVVDRFRPLVKEAISAAILEMVGQSFAPQAPAPAPEPAPEEPEAEGEVVRSRISTTEEELRAFQIVSEIASGHVPEPDKLKYQDTTAYFAVLYAKTTGWFVRLWVQDRERKAACFRLPVEQVRQLAPGFEVEEAPAGWGASRVYFQSVEDLAGMRDLLAAAVREVA